MPSVKTSIAISEEAANALKEIAKADRRSVSAVVEILILDARDSRKKIKK